MPVGDGVARLVSKGADLLGELASRIATHREAVSREMSSLAKKSGVLGKEHKTLVINNVDDLRALRDDKGD